jgi:hypothetical protein
MTVNLFLPQVTRVPITGPEPFNTLVCVSAETYMGGQVVVPGHLYRYPVRVPTPFRLAGFDQRVPPVFNHSTTAWLSSVGPAEDDKWLYAVDSVTGAGFNPTDGSYFVDLMGALYPGDPVPETCIALGAGGGVCFYFMIVQVTSYVLCFEPAVPAVPRGRSSIGMMSGQQNLQKAHSLVELVSERLGVAVSLATKTKDVISSTPCDCAKVKKL